MIRTIALKRRDQCNDTYKNLLKLTGATTKFLSYKNKTFPFLLFSKRKSPKKLVVYSPTSEIFKEKLISSITPIF